jgi:hypothetical protein
MKTSRMKEVIPVDENCHFSAMAELQRNIVRRIEVVQSNSSVKGFVISAN